MEIRGISNSDRWNNVGQGKEPDSDPYDIDVEVQKQEQSPQSNHQILPDRTQYCSNACTFICYTAGVGRQCRGN